MAFIKSSTIISFSVALLATAVALSAVSGHSAAVNPFCTTADDKTLCTQMAKGANTWPKAMTNVLTAALEKAHAGKPIVERVGSKLPATLLPQTLESIDVTCTKTYEDVVYNLERCIEFMKNKDYSSLLSYISAVSFAECTDGAEEFEVSLPEAAGLSGEIMKMVSILLAVASKKP